MPMHLSNVGGQICTHLKKKNLQPVSVTFFVNLQPQLYMGESHTR